MSRSVQPTSAEGRHAVRALFETGGPVLVEVRFPGSATSPDWYLCDDDEDFDAVVEKLGPGAELFCSRVADLTNRRGEVYLRK
jgi:hypothetical protein